MADRYFNDFVPETYDPEFFRTEFNKLAAAFSEMELERLRYVPQGTAPTRVFNGLVVYANGTDWNPGHGEGLYEYKDEWVPLFPLHKGGVLTRTTVSNTVTETTIYSVTIDAEELVVGERIRVTVSGYYDTDAASDTWTLRVKLDGTAVHTVVRQSGNNASSFGWELEFYGTVRSEGASGTMIDFSKLFDDDTTKASDDETVHSIDTTGDIVLTVTLQWGAAKVGNIFNIDQGFTTLEHL